MSNQNLSLGKTIWLYIKQGLQASASPLVHKAIHSLHKIMILLYLSIASFILLTAGVFMIVVRSVSQYQSKGFLYFDAINSSGLVIVVLCSIASWWLLREKRLFEILL